MSAATDTAPHAAGIGCVATPFEGSKPHGLPIDVLSGFLNSDEEAQGRPVGVAIDRHGDLLVAADVGNSVWRVSAAAAAAP